LWALFRAANRSSLFHSFGEQAFQKLGYSAIESELIFLETHPKFEMPYGRAWLLRLTIEYEKWCDLNYPNEKLAMMRISAFAAESLLNYFKQRKPDIMSADYSNDSWVLVQLFSYFDYTEHTSPKELDTLIDKLIEQGNDLSFSSDYWSDGFFSVFGNWIYLIAKTRSDAAFFEVLSRHPIPNMSLNPLKSVQSISHRFGLNWSRAWSLKSIYEKRPESATAKFLPFYWSHVESGMRTHRIYAGNYRAYGHWVPQFAVYALTHN
jgi:hypothetical protein